MLFCVRTRHMSPLMLPLKQKALYGELEECVLNDKTRKTLILFYFLGE
jgi:hypothetical protein